MHATAEDHRDEVVFPGDGEPGGAQADIAQRERAALARFGSPNAAAPDLPADLSEAEALSDKYGPNDISL